MREDRRALRRNETVREILDAALAVMADEGVAALSLAEVARRVGMRPPSLYEYFPSKMAVYDALFERGATDLLRLAERQRDALAGDPLSALRAGQHSQFAWALDNPVLAQLLFWRPVPGFEPSAQAYRPAVELIEELGSALRAAVDAGQLAPAAATEDGIAIFATLFAGVISQQLSNEPVTTVDKGRFTRLAGDFMDMYVRYFSPGKGRAT
ncbi:MAG TPA: TetR/AcrR family transcriptional regulator [Micromonosporaceae bacterium]